MVSIVRSHELWRKHRRFDSQPRARPFSSFPHTLTGGVRSSATHVHARVETTSSQQQAHTSETRRVYSSVEKDAAEDFQFSFKPLRITIKSLILKLLYLFIGLIKLGDFGHFGKLVKCRNF